MTRMLTIDDIWRRAEKDLVVRNSRNASDSLLWEHSSGVARASVLIARQDSFAHLKLDPIVLTAAALYHDIYHAQASDGSGFCDSDCISRTGDATQRERSADLVRSKLDKFLNSRTLDMVAGIVGQVGLREADRVEARIISDADNLYQLGLMALWPVIRQGAITGKGIKDLIDHCHARRTYGYWVARRSCFFFPEVCDLAERRLEAFEKFVDNLEREWKAGDVEDWLASSTTATSILKPPDPPE